MFKVQKIFSLDIITNKKYKLSIKYNSKSQFKEIFYLTFQI